MLQNTKWPPKYIVRCVLDSATILKGCNSCNSLHMDLKMDWHLNVECVYILTERNSPRKLCQCPNTYSSLYIWVAILYFVTVYCIYICHRLSDAQIFAKLSGQTGNRFEVINQAFSLHPLLSDLSLWCDWTKLSGKTYFFLSIYMKAYFPTKSEWPYPAPLVKIEGEMGKTWHVYMCKLIK